MRATQATFDAFKKIKPLLIEKTDCPHLSLTVAEADDIFTVWLDYEGKSELARFHISQMPGCRAVAIFSRSWVRSDYQGKGIGTLLHKMRLDAAKAGGFSVAICTIDVNNKPQRAILEKFRWVDRGSPFTNADTGHTVQVWMCFLHPVTAECIEYEG